MKVKTADLIGPALDWAVAKTEGLVLGQVAIDGVTRGFYQPSTKWSQGGPIVEREGIDTRESSMGGWCAGAIVDYGNIVAYTAYGPTLLIAAMRCYIIRTVGHDIDVPDELL